MVQLCLSNHVITMCQAIKATTVTAQDAFRPGEAEPIRSRYPRFAKGNTLFSANTEGGFDERGGRDWAELGDWAWASLFADLDNDGWEDLLVTNGYITGTEEDDL